MPWRFRPNRQLAGKLMKQTALHKAGRASWACTRFWAAVRDAWRETGGVEPYRREVHYMRGRGPKWRAKYGQLSALNSDKR